MAIKIPAPRWPGDPEPGKPQIPRIPAGGTRGVRPQIYGVMPVAQVESELRRDKMPAPFVRRMRVINILSAVTLRKIEDNMIAPFDTMDIHHVLDQQISQDAIIAVLDNKNLALAIETGNMQPLWVESKENPLLRKGFEQGWIQRFIATPFDPICVMLAMRAKLMLNVVDELGHSYDLLRSLGMGWIDFGEIPGEEPGDPDSYVPPIIDQPISYPDLPPDPVPGDPDYVPGPGEPGYIPPEDLVPGDPGHTPGPGDPGYIPPGDLVPGDPGYVPGPEEPGYIPPPDRVPGDPGYPIVPGESPDYPEGWDEAIYPGHPEYEPGPGEAGYIYPSSPGGGLYGGDFGPGGQGAMGGPAGAGGIYGGLAPPLTLGFGPESLLSRGWYTGNMSWGALNCCLDKDDPESYVGIGYLTTEMNPSEIQGLTVEQADPACDGSNYEWLITAGGGELSEFSGLTTQYTAPASGANCPGNTEITLFCGGEVMATLDITINYDYAIEFNYGDPELEIARENSLVVSVTANGTPLTWAVSGTGFSLEHAETDGAGNVLHADETACGLAIITVTDCDGNVAIGYVRCTAGKWSAYTNGCIIPGPYDTSYSGHLTRTKGKYRQEQVLSAWKGLGAAPEYSCSEVSCKELAGEENCIDCLEWTCLDISPANFDCGDWCCGQAGCGPYDPGPPYSGWDGGFCIKNIVLRYQEWIC